MAHDILSLFAVGDRLVHTDSRFAIRKSCKACRSSNGSVSKRQNHCDEPLDRKHPDREDGAQRYQAADRPSGCVEDFVVAGAAHRVGFRGHRAPQHGTAPESLPATITPAEVAGSISRPGSLKTWKSQELERALVLRRWPGYRRQGGKIT